MQIAVTTLSGLMLGLMVGLLRVDTPLIEFKYLCSTILAFLNRPSHTLIHVYVYTVKHRYAEHFGIGENLI